MKKLSLLILIFTFNVYSAAIDVGETVSDAYSNNDSTVINLANPANDTGTIDHIDVKTGANGTIDFAAFTDEGSSVYSTNGVAQGYSAGTGVLSLDAPGDFTAFAISTGEFIGMYCDDLNVMRFIDSGAGTVMRVQNDNIPASSVSFSTTWTDWGYYLYATGVSGGTNATVTPDALPITLTLHSPTVLLENPSILQGATIQGATLN